jgi:hypothetical protein
MVREGNYQKNREWLKRRYVRGIKTVLSGFVFRTPGLFKVLPVHGYNPPECLYL